MTTVVGFLTNLVSPVGALKDFGVLAAVGIVSAFFLLLTFVPSVRLLLDRRAEKLDRWPGEDLYASKERLLPRLIGKSAWLAKKAPAITVSVAIALGGVGFYGVTQLDTQFSFVDFVPTDSPLYHDALDIANAWSDGARVDVARDQASDECTFIRLMKHSALQQ